jgi:hypothetical protein
MQFKLEIDCGNAAFEDDAAAEIARILADLANRLQHEQMQAGNRVHVEHSVRDVNGNRCGNWAFAL